MISRKPPSACRAMTPAKFLPYYVEAGILPKDPFVSMDIDGVGGTSCASPPNVVAGPSRT